MTTLGDLLKEMASQGQSRTAKQLSSKLEYQITMRQCYVIYLIATNGTIDTILQHAKQGLRHQGLAYCIECPMNSRATNGKIKKVYRLTPDGELAYADILKKFQPIVDRINNK